MVDLGSLVLLMSSFGWEAAAAYVVLGLVLAAAGGTLIEKMHFEIKWRILSVSEVPLRYHKRNSNSTIEGSTLGNKLHLMF